MFGMSAYSPVSLAGAYLPTCCFMQNRPNRKKEEGWGTKEAESGRERAGVVRRKWYAAQPALFLLLLRVPQRSACLLLHAQTAARFKVKHGALRYSSWTSLLPACPSEAAKNGYRLTMASVRAVCKVATGLVGRCGLRPARPVTFLHQVNKRCTLSPSWASQCKLCRGFLLKHKMLFLSLF